jgi:hypothetical protein
MTEAEKKGFMQRYDALKSSGCVERMHAAVARPIASRHVAARLDWIGWHPPTSCRYAVVHNAGWPSTSSCFFSTTLPTTPRYVPAIRSIHSESSNRNEAVQRAPCPLPRPCRCGGSCAAQPRPATQTSTAPRPCSRAPPPRTYAMPALPNAQYSAHNGANACSPRPSHPHPSRHLTPVARPRPRPRPTLCPDD